MITTPEFGGYWGQLPFEKSIVVNVHHITNTDVFKQTLQAKLGFYVVEVINNEVISAATDPNQGMMLLHCRVESTGLLTFTVKTATQATLADLEIRHLPNFGSNSNPPSNNLLAGIFWSFYVLILSINLSIF